jgi:hypothetical protein
LKTTHFFNNVSGLNLTDSPFYIKDGQATGGYNYDYVRTGGIQKIRGLSAINSVADTELQSIGLGTHVPQTGSKVVLRAAGTRIQTVDLSSGACTNLANDAASPITAFLSAGSTQAAIMQGFSTPGLDITWITGGGLTLPHGYVNGKVTQNGVPAPTGTFTAVNSGAGSGGAWGAATGVYYYSLALRKASTKAISNAALDQTITIATATDSVLLTLPTGVDTTMYDYWYIYRSSVGGVTGFTAGSIVAMEPTTTTTFRDLHVTYAGSQVVPRAGSVALDNSTLPINTSGVYSWKASADFVTSNVITYTINGGTPLVTNFTTDNATTLAALVTQLLTNINILGAFSDGNHTITITGVAGTVIAITAASVTGGASQPTLTQATITDIVATGAFTSMGIFKKHLVVAAGSSVYFSDTDKSESWPTGLRFTVPSAGPITGVASIGYYSMDGVSDEYLVVFKERETWVVTGSTLWDDVNSWYDLALKHVDNVGCLHQSLAVRAGGYLCWLDYRGAYMWNGQGRPIYTSRPIEAMFGLDGQLDKTGLDLAWATFSRRKNQVMWCISDRTKGTNKVILKLDLRLTKPATNEGIEWGTVIAEGVFMQDALGTALYAGTTFLPSDNEEIILVGDGAGFLYKAYYGATNAGGGIDFSYQTKAFEFGSPAIAKQFSKVVVYIDKSVSADLVMDYWAGYRVLLDQRSTTPVDMAVGGRIAGSFWDLANWDEALWDEGTTEVTAISFNLSGAQNNNQGDSLMLKFSQGDASVPVTIHGFTVFWDELGARK